jgi:hypothetical protein
MAVAMLVVGGVACRGKSEAPKDEVPSSLGQQAGSIVSDEAVLKDASAAVNDVVRAVGDCDAVRAALPEAQRTLETSLPKLRTPTGRATLESLKVKLKSTAETCP